MLLGILMLLSFYAATAHGQDFVCGFGLGGEEEAGDAAMFPNATFYQNSTTADPIKVLLLFGKFAGTADPKNLNTYKFSDRDGNTRLRSTQIVDPDVKGSLAHYFNEMSYGNLSLVSADVEVQKRWYEAPRPSLSGCTIYSWSAALKDFSRGVLTDADADVDFSDVDLVAVLTPAAFGDSCGADGTAISNLNWQSAYRDSAGNPITIDVAITSDWRNSFPFFVGVLAHEYGHVMGLPELFDRTNHDSTTSFSKHSAGIGKWGVMGKGSDGYVKTANVPDGPAPL